MLERTIEAAVIRHAKKRCERVEVVKLNGMGKRSLPDRMFLFPGGQVLFIEFKRECERPTPLQRHLHAQWRALGHRVYVIDNIDDGVVLIDSVTATRDDLAYPVPR